jgi:hypothetical protein
MMALAKALGQQNLTVRILKMTKKLASLKQGIVGDETDSS